MSRERPTRAEVLHERFAPDWLAHWWELDDQEQAESEWFDVASVALAWMRDRLAEHTPACSGPHTRREYGRGAAMLDVVSPVNGHTCGPIYCVQCSAAARDWVVWTPEHVADHLGAGESR